MKSRVATRGSAIFFDNFMIKTMKLYDSLILKIRDIITSSKVEV